MASRLRVAASACLVASGLFMCGAGGAIALADPGPGYGRSDDLTDDDSIGDIVRRAFGLGDGNDAKASEPAQGPHPRWGNGRQGQVSGREGTAEDGHVPDERTADERTAHDEADHPVPRTHQTQRNHPAIRNRICPKAAGGGGGGAIEQLPRYTPPSIPEMQLPDELQPGQPGVAGGPAVLDAGAGIAAAAPVGPRRPSPCR